jgi:hypothetical protein
VRLSSKSHYHTIKTIYRNTKLDCIQGKIQNVWNLRKYFNFSENQYISSIMQRKIIPSQSSRTAIFNTVIVTVFPILEIKVFLTDRGFFKKSPN